MIESIALENFQSHKSSKLELVPGVNTIIGQSDSGKTAILRALRWLVWNRPTGEAFQSYWGGTTQIRVGFDNCPVVRGKDNGQNIYQLDADLFKAFGTDVPEEIQAAIGLNEINLQQQLDRPFLLDNSPGEVAQHFNRVAHLDSIDKGTQAVQKWVRQIDNDIRNGEQHLNVLKEQLSSFNYLAQMELDVAELESDAEKYQSLRNDRDTLHRLIENIEAIIREESWHTPLLDIEPDVNAVLELYAQLEQKEKDYSILETLLHNIDQVDTLIEQEEAILSLEDQINSVLVDIGKLKGMQLRAQDLSRLLTRINTTETELNNSESELKGLELTFHESMPSTCPLCSQEVK